MDAIECGVTVGRFGVVEVLLWKAWSDKCLLLFSNINLKKKNSADFSEIRRTQFFLFSFDDYGGRNVNLLFGAIL